MNERVAKLGLMLRQTVFDWIDDKAPQLGAALAFYTALSIAPLLVISLGIAALVFGEEAARGGVQDQMQFLVGDQGAKAIEEMISSANDTGKGVVATGLSLVILLVSRCVRRFRSTSAKLERDLESAAESWAGHRRNR